MARAFAKNCKKLGIAIHADFIIGLPGETKETIERTIEFAKELDAETIQVSVAHAYPGNRVLRLRREERLPGRRGVAPMRRPSASAPRVSRPGAGRNDGGDEPLLRLLLLPAARGVAHRPQSAVGPQTSASAFTKRRWSTCACAPSAGDTRGMPKAGSRTRPTMPEAVK